MAHKVRGTAVSLPGPVLMTDTQLKPSGEDARAFPTLFPSALSPIGPITFQPPTIGTPIGEFTLPPITFGRDTGRAVPNLGGACDPGFVRDQTGICVFQGSPADISTGPSGPGFTGSSGQAVMGAFGIPAMLPIIVGNIGGAPIRRCMAGAVLGKDDLCYMKGSIPRQFRKWRPAAKPPMSAADAKALRRIGTLQNKVKGLAKSANLTCKRK